MNNQEKVWFVKPNDLIGGWSIMNCDKTIGNARFEDGEEEVASFASEEDARHIVRLHNRWHHNRVRFSDEPVKDVVKAFDEGEKGVTGHGQQADHQLG